MAYPGIALAVLLGFGIGVAMYIILTNNVEQQHYRNDRPHNGRREQPEIILPHSPQRRNTKRSPKRKCDICDAFVNYNKVRFDCGHVYHKMCLKTRSTQLYGSSTNSSVSSMQHHLDKPQCVLCYEVPSTTEKCCICYENLEDNLCKLSCDHEFHSKCITQWFRTSKTCPFRCSL